MRNFLVFTALFLGLLGVSVAQHGGGQGHPGGGQQPHFSPPAQQHEQHNGGQRGGGYGRIAPPSHGGGYHDNRGGFQDHRGFQGRPDYHRGGYGDWYGHRREYRGFGWGHYRGWHYRPYVYLGPGYCYAGAWGAPYYSFGFNSSRWRVLDFDFGIVNGWYPGSCAYVMADPYHDGWFLLYDQQTGEYVHVEQEIGNQY